MDAAETVAELTRFERRGAGTDAERRAALWLAGQLGADGREAVVEPFWCRPNWALTHMWHVALGLAGSLVSVGSPRIGAGMVLVALLSLLADVLLGVSPGRRLTLEHASQNVVSPPPEDLDQPGDRRVRLILTANYDAGRTGLVHRDRPRATAARLRALTGGRGPGWLGWLAILLGWLLVTAILRVRGGGGEALAVAQLASTVVLVLALAALLELAGAEYSPGAGDNGTGVAIAIAMAQALDAAPPRHAAVELVLSGAGDGPGIGLTSYLRRHKRAPADTVVLGIAACAAGAPRWWCSDGALLPLRYFPRLHELCAVLAAEEPQLGARAHRGRGSSPALPARVARLPAIAIGCLDERGLVPRSHQPADTPDAVQAAALDHTLELGLLLVDALDAFLDASASAAVEA
ncbi:MAG: hypothetical protein DLM64_13710 [Solirubrobacterales bacterium]|nr:MAG: hypothetical protein DLM64_13710 [Solirubrobacterales bacterium]